MSTEKPQTALYARLKIVRKAFGLRQSDMADKIGLAISTYQYYERGERDVPGWVLEEITTYGVNPAWLLTGRGEPLQPQGESVKETSYISGKPPHSTIIERFRQQELAWDIDWNLYRLEQADPRALQDLNELIEFKLQKLAGKVEYDRRQSQRRNVKEKDRAPDEERRIAERRIASGG